MKKTIVAIALVLTGLVSKAQQIKTQTNFGIVSNFHKKEVGDWMLANFVGLEFNDKIGIEYGYAYSLNTDANELSNYLYGNAKSWTAGSFNHLIAAYWKSKRDEGSCVNVGAGLSILNEYTTEGIERKSTPYLKIGIDQEFGKGWGGQINGGFGNSFIFTIGITKTL
jgi:hypothetical protein